MYFYYEILLHKYLIASEYIFGYDLLKYSCWNRNILKYKNESKNNNSNRINSNILGMYI